MIVLAVGVLAAPAFANVEPVRAIPANNPGEWVTTDDYPPAALRAGVQGIAGFQVLIDEQGAVTQCMITQSSGSPDLDAETCASVYQRAHFTPATDADGRPAKGSFRSRVKWVIPSTVPAPVASTTILHFTVEPDGSSSHCEGLESKNHGSAFVPRPCPSVTFEPYRNAAGTPVRKLVTSTVTITTGDAPVGAQP